MNCRNGSPISMTSPRTTLTRGHDTTLVHRSSTAPHPTLPQSSRQVFFTRKFPFRRECLQALRIIARVIGQHDRVGCSHLLRRAAASFLASSSRPHSCANTSSTACLPPTGLHRSIEVSPQATNLACARYRAAAATTASFDELGERLSLPQNGLDVGTKLG